MHVFNYSYGPLDLFIKDGKKEEKKSYSFTLDIRAKTDLHVNPITIAAAFDVYKANLNGVSITIEPGDDMDECRGTLQEAVMEQIEVLLKTNGRWYFPGKRIIKYRLETHIAGEESVTSDWITLKITKEN